MNFFDYTMEHVRLTVLRILTEASEYRANDSILSQSVAAMGLPCTRDQMRTQLAWLEEQHLVHLAKPTPTLTVVSLTERGADVACGRASQPGVQRPGPGA